MNNDKCIQDKYPHPSSIKCSINSKSVPEPLTPQNYSSIRGVTAIVKLFKCLKHILTLCNMLVNTVEYCSDGCKYFSKTASGILVNTFFCNYSLVFLLFCYFCILLFLFISFVFSVAKIYRISILANFNIE